ncbi:hypothetical protein V8F20_007934 [Naviculisporaceae sp. PSN 640]
MDSEKKPKKYVPKAPPPRNRARATASNQTPAINTARDTNTTNQTQAISTAQDTRTTPPDVPTGMGGDPPLNRVVGWQPPTPGDGSYVLPRLHRPALFYMDRPITCFHCGQEGHTKSRCPRRDNASTFRQENNATALQQPSNHRNTTCFTCGQLGHPAPQCNDQDPARRQLGVIASRGTATLANLVRDALSNVPGFAQFIINPNSSGPKATHQPRGSANPTLGGGAAAITTTSSLTSGSVPQNPASTGIVGNLPTGPAQRANSILDLKFNTLGTKRRATPDNGDWKTKSLKGTSLDSPHPADKEAEKREAAKKDMEGIIPVWHVGRPLPGPPPTWSCCGTVIPEDGSNDFCRHNPESPNPKPKSHDESTPNPKPDPKRDNKSNPEAHNK